MKDYLLINLDNKFIEELFDTDDMDFDSMLGIVLHHLKDRAKHESSIELEEETVEIIERYGDTIGYNKFDVYLAVLPMDKDDQLKLLEKLKKYYDEYQPVKEKWENDESDDDEDYIVLQHMASNYEDIKFMVESAGKDKTPVVVAF